MRRRGGGAGPAGGGSLQPRAQGAQNTRPAALCLGSASQAVRGAHALEADPVHEQRELRGVHGDEREECDRTCSPAGAPGQRQVCWYQGVLEWRVLGAVLNKQSAMTR